MKTLADLAKWADFDLHTSEFGVVRCGMVSPRTFVDECLVTLFCCTH